MTVEICEPLWRLTSIKAVLTWNRTYQEIYKRAKSLVKEYTCMKYYDVRMPLYLETDASEVCLDTALLQVRKNLTCGYCETPDNAMLQPIAFASKSQSSAEQ